MRRTLALFALLLAAQTAHAAPDSVDPYAAADGYQQRLQQAVQVAMIAETAFGCHMRPGTWALQVEQRLFAVTNQIRKGLAGHVSNKVLFENLTGEIDREVMGSFEAYRTAIFEAGASISDCIALHRNPGALKAADSVLTDFPPASGR